MAIGPAAWVVVVVVAFVADMWIGPCAFGKRLSLPTRGRERRGREGKAGEGRRGGTRGLDVAAGDSGIVSCIHPDARDCHAASAIKITSGVNVNEIKP